MREERAERQGTKKPHKTTEPHLGDREPRY